MTDKKDEDQLSDEVIENSLILANEILEDAFERIDIDQEDDEYDPVFVIYSLTTSFIEILHNCGWSTQELVNEVFNHTQEHIGETLQ